MHTFLSLFVSLVALSHTHTLSHSFSRTHTSTNTPLSSQPSPITHRSHWPDKEGFSLQKFFEANIFNRPIHVYGGNRPAETLGVSLPPRFSSPHFSFLLSFSLASTFSLPFFLRDKCTTLSTITLRFVLIYIRNQCIFIVDKVVHLSLRKNGRENVEAREKERRY